jgi:hypothetical protein
VTRLEEAALRHRLSRLEMVVVKLILYLGSQATDHALMCQLVRDEPEVDELMRKVDK